MESISKGNYWINIKHSINLFSVCNFIRFKIKLCKEIIIAATRQKCIKIHLYDNNVRKERGRNVVARNKVFIYC